MSDLGIILVLGGILVCGILYWRWSRSKSVKTPTALGGQTPTIPPVQESTAVSDEAVSESSTISPRPLSDRLSKTRGNLFGKLGTFLSRRGRDISSEAEWEALEEVLLGADIGLSTVSTLLEKVKENSQNSNGASLSELLQQASIDLLDSVQPEKDPYTGTQVKPLVISVVGVNGVGKTTTIGKLAQYFKDQNKSVLLGAADTFRAGAIAQLKVWSDRVGTEFVTGREGADPGAVSFDSVTAAKARGVDICILDTAGRLHTKSNLMEELKKIHRVVKKVIPEAPHEVLLVLDGTLGQNSIQQAKQFSESLGVTGVVVSKLDGTAKGGAVLGVAETLGLPVRFIGVGESKEDLLPFDSKSFIDAILGDATFASA